MKVTQADITEARALYAQLSRAPVPAAALRQAVAGNRDAEKQVDVFSQLSVRVSDPSGIDGAVLSDALSAAGLSIEEMRGKMGRCPAGARPKPALPSD